MAAFELFHKVADGPSGRMRKLVAELGLLSQVSFRNVHFDSHREALEKLGGGEIPALWDGVKLHVGEAAVEARLRAG